MARRKTKNIGILNRITLMLASSFFVDINEFGINFGLKAVGAASWDCELIPENNGGTVIKTKTC